MAYPFALTLANPGCETGDMTGWDSTSGGLGQARTSGTDVPAFAGAYYFAGAAAVAAAWGQTVSLPSGVLTDVDAGTLYLVGSVMVQGDSGDSDSSKIKLECFDASNTSLGSVETASLDPTAWERHSVLMAVPTGTRSVRIGTDETRTSGAFVSVYYDDFEMHLTDVASTKWRVVCLSNRSSQVGLNEVEMAMVPGGTNECVGGTATAKTEYGAPTYFAGGAFDGNYNSPPSWFGNTVNGNWIQYEFASAKNITEIRLVRGDADNNGTPRLMAFQYYDGSNWITSWYGFRDDWTDNTLKTFTKPTGTSFRYWGIANLSGAGDPGGTTFWDTDIREMEIRASPGGTDATTPGGGSPVGFPISAAAAGAFDDNPATIFYTGASGFQTFLAYDFGSATTMAEYAFTRDSNSSNINRAPGTGAVIASNDSYAYAIIDTYALSVTDYASGTAIVTFGSTAPTETVGTATATSSALGVSEVTGGGNTVGTATATSSAVGRMVALGVISLAGQAQARGVALGVSDPIRPTVGVSTGTGTALGAGAAVGTISTVGNAVGTSFADSGSAATGILATVGNASATSSANADMSGRQEATGTASATSTAVAVGSYVPSATVGRSDGVGVAIARSTAFRTFAGQAFGRGETLGVMAGVRGVVGDSAGTGSAQGISDQNQSMAGSASATSSALGIGTGIASTVGAADGTSTADSGGSYVPSDAVGVSTGGSTALGVGSVLRSMVGNAAATSTANASNDGVAQAVGAGTGSSTSVGVSRELHLMRGSASGTSTGDGISDATAFAVGYATATSFALGIGLAILPGVDSSDIVLVEAEDYLVGVAAPGDTLVVVAVDDEIVVVPFNDNIALAA